MALTLNGKDTLTAIVENPKLFKALKPADLSRAALGLAKKQLAAGRQDLAAYRDLREALGKSNFAHALEALTATQQKALVKRLDPHLDGISSLKGSEAVRHVLALLEGEVSAMPKPKAAPKKKAAPEAEASPARKKLKKRASSTATRRRQS